MCPTQKQNSYRNLILIQSKNLVFYGFAILKGFYLTKLSTWKTFLKKIVLVLQIEVTEIMLLQIHEAWFTRKFDDVVQFISSIPGHVWTSPVNARCASLWNMISWNNNKMLIYNNGTSQVDWLTYYVTLILNFNRLLTKNNRKKDKIIII